MTLKMMGTPPTLLSSQETAKILGTSSQTLKSLVRQGLLKPHWKGNKRCFEQDDILAFMKVFQNKTDWSSIAALAMRAYVKAEANERKLAEISDLLGLGLFSLEVDDESVQSLYNNTHNRLELGAPTSSAEAMLLAKRCLALTEEYLKIVERVTGDDEPWRPFLQLTQHVCENAPRKYFPHDIELATAYGYLEAARRHVRPLAYFYVRGTHGRRVANETFGMQQDYATPIVRTLFPS